MQQILGLDHAPKALPVTDDTPAQPEHRFIGLGGSASAGDFSFRFSESTTVVKHIPTQTTLTADYGTLTAEKAIEVDFSVYAPERLVGDWYQISFKTDASDDIKKAMYCPERRYICMETYPATFPEKQFRAIACGILANARYYAEKSFVNLLLEFGMTLDALREIPGMTALKIHTMFENRSSLSSLLRTGIRFTDLAGVDEERFTHVLSNYADAENALEFVDVLELFGRGDAASPSSSSSSSSSSFFRPSASYSLSASVSSSSLSSSSSSSSATSSTDSTSWACAVL